MRFLVDTNVWLELLLNQQRAQEVRSLLEQREGSDFALTEFSLYSIGIVLTRLNKDAAFENFIADALEQAGTRVIRLGPADMTSLLAARRQFRLDFDDAYQYVAAEKHNLTLLSFDADFDRTARGRKTPAALQSAP
jgi:predicted nucleic acid-binding protein